MKLCDLKTANKCVRNIHNTRIKEILLIMACRRAFPMIAFHRPESIHYNNIMIVPPMCYIHTHCKNKIVTITNSFVSTVAKNNRNCNLIGYVGHCRLLYDCMETMYMS